MLKVNEYWKTVRRPYPPLYVSLIAKGYSDTKNNIPFIGEDKGILNLIQLDSLWYYEVRNSDLLGDLAFNEWTKPGRLKEIILMFDKLENNLIHSTNSTFKEFAHHFKAYQPALNLIWLCERPAEKKIKELLNDKLSSEEAKDLMDKLNIPLEDNFYKQEELELISTKDLKAHVKKYEWILARYGSKNKYTIEQAKEKLSKINKEEFLEKRKKEKEEVAEAIAKAKEILGDDSVLVDLVQYLIYYRTQRTDIMNKSIFLFIPKLEEMAKERGITYKQMLYCSEDEINSTIPSLEIINDRIKGYSMIYDSDGIRFVTGKENEDLKKMFHEDHEGISEVKGTVASQGKVKGMARLILSREDFENVQKGDIIVTSMTTPEMIPAMERAAAFVTDEGGITCHAAIVSRELGKPCVIGTKIATDIFKDGDVVEVDANSGVVRRVKN